MQVIKGDKKDLWYPYSGCSRHMTGNKTKFAKLELKEEGFVIYGDNNKGKILGNGVIDNESSFNIKNVLLVEGLKHNLISVPAENK